MPQLVHQIGRSCGKTIYLRGYRFDMNSHHAADVANDTAVELVATAYLEAEEPPERQPHMSWKVNAEGSEPSGVRAP